MIASITGRLRRKAADYLIVDVAGVGYQLQVPLSTFSSIPDTGEEVSLHVHTHLREDSLSLFGFLTEPEKDAFLLLMGVSGIGPKLALSVLSSMQVPDLVAAIQCGDDTRLCGIPGIGKKTAARMVLELKDKMKQSGAAAASHPASPTTVHSKDREDVIAALVNLGYKKPLAEEAVKNVQSSRPKITVEELIREALSMLMKK